MNAALPRVPPLPMFSVLASVPDRVRVLLTVRVLDVVPPATVNPVDAAVRVRPLYVFPVNADAILLSAMVVALQVPVVMVPTVTMLVEPGTSASSWPLFTASLVLVPLASPVIFCDPMAIAPDIVPPALGSALLATVLTASS